MENETKIPLKNGKVVCCQSAEENPNGTDYVRIEDKDGNELVYWHHNEWTEDPQLVMGAIMGAMANGN